MTYNCRLWKYNHVLIPFSIPPPSIWYDCFVDFTVWVDFVCLQSCSKYGYILCVPFGTCKGYSFGLNRQKKPFLKCDIINIIYKNILFRIANCKISLSENTLATVFIFYVMHTFHFKESLYSWVWCTNTFESTWLNLCDERRYMIKYSLSPRAKPKGFSKG